MHKRRCKYTGKHEVVFLLSWLLQPIGKVRPTRLATNTTQAAMCALIIVNSKWGQWGWANIIWGGPHGLSRILVGTEVRKRSGGQKERVSKDLVAWERFVALSGRGRCGWGTVAGKLAGYLFLRVLHAMLRSCWEKYNKGQMGQNCSTTSQNSNRFRDLTHHLRLLGTRIYGLCERAFIRDSETPGPQTWWPTSHFTSTEGALRKQKACLETAVLYIFKRGSIDNTLWHSGNRSQRTGRNCNYMAFWKWMKSSHRL